MLSIRATTSDDARIFWENDGTMEICILSHIRTYEAKVATERFIENSRHDIREYHPKLHVSCDLCY